ncbi:hypothetical protein Clacol_010328 [Clathrus columnatus]|uniref:DUF6533 domain-containing protein n=1 Tax=Clathrus columnatus TaxID=1419009 RepID=A0AAV5AN67_9AGAM|nr:hypothetical protein Clacol_010328 [Clathrus columnatus]
MSTFAPEPWDPTWHPTLQARIDYQASHYAGMAAIAVLFYDTILTIPEAVEYIYLRKFTLISWFYVIAQYAIGIQGLLFSRAYAVAPKNRIISGLLGCLFLMNLGVALSLLRWWKCDAPESDDYTTTYFPISVYRIISAWSLGDAIYFKLARPSASGSDTNLEIALSPILLNHFLFELRETAEKTDNMENTDDTIESHQMTNFLVADNWNYDSTTTVYTALPQALTSGTASTDFDTPPSRTPL